MSYIVADDLVAAYGHSLVNKISTPEGSTQSDPAVIQRGIDSAGSIIDAYIGGRYTLPLAVVPPVLVELAIDIAIYKISLATTRRTPEMRLRYDDALKMLGEIADAKVSIGLSMSDLQANGDQDIVKQRLGKSIRTYRI